MRAHNPNRLPYQPPPTPHGVPYRHDYRRSIIYSLQYRGDNDDVPTILVVGAPIQLVIDTFKALFGFTSAFVHDYIITREHSCMFSYDNHYWRVAVEVDGLHGGCISVSDIMTLFEQKIQELCWCRSVQYRKLETLLNR